MQCVTYAGFARHTEDNRHSKTNEKSQAFSYTIIARNTGRQTILPFVLTFTQEQLPVLCCDLPKDKQIEAIFDLNETYKFSSKAEKWKTYELNAVVDAHNVMPAFIRTKFWTRNVDIFTGVSRVEPLQL